MRLLYKVHMHHHCNCFHQLLLVHRLCDQLVQTLLERSQFECSFFLFLFLLFVLFDPSRSLCCLVVVKRDTALLGSEQTVAVCEVVRHVVYHGFFLTFIHFFFLIRLDSVVIVEVLGELFPLCLLL